MTLFYRRTICVHFNNCLCPLNKNEFNNVILVFMYAQITVLKKLNAKKFQTETKIYY